MSRTYISATLRKLVYDRAKGCCEYCLMPEIGTFAIHEIDHIIAEKHGGVTQADNLALACVLCNQRKGSDIASVDPKTNKIIPLYHPRKDNWSKHFKLKEGHILPLTTIGRVTVFFLQFNCADRVSERLLLIDAGIFKID